VTSTDNLRNALAACLDELLGDEYDPNEQAVLDALMAVIGDEALRGAILSGPMNLEVTDVSPLSAPRTSFAVRPRSEEATDA
jgi:hypothetical protein